MLKIPFITSIRQRRINSLKTNIELRQNEQRKQFYNKYQTFDKVRDFEVASCVASDLVKQKPDNISERKYYQYLKEIYRGNKNTEKSYKKLNPNAHPYTVAVKNYYAQHDFLYPTQDNLREGLDFDRVKTQKKLVKENEKEKFTKAIVLKILNESKDLTLDSSNILKRRYARSIIYDFPLRFATACYNSRDLGNGYINGKTPEIFKDIEKEELFEAMDLFSTRYRDYFHGKKFNIKMEIGGKNFDFEYIKSGKESTAFRISDDKNNTAVLKLFKTKAKAAENNITFAPFGIYGNIGILREANLAGVKDVPELYFTNPIFMPVTSEGSGYMGGWAIIEDVSDKKVQDGLKLEDWLMDLGLHLTDSDNNNRLNDILIDLDNVSNKKECALQDSELVNQIYSHYLNYETTEEIIEFLKQQ